jgi:hypothetical protein
MFFCNPGQGRTANSFLRCYLGSSDRMGAKLFSAFRPVNLVGPYLPQTASASQHRYICTFRPRTCTYYTFLTLIMEDNNVKTKPVISLAKKIYMRTLPNLFWELAMISCGSDPFFSIVIAPNLQDKSVWEPSIQVYNKYGADTTSWLKSTNEQ